MTNDLDLGLKVADSTGNILNDACHIIETAQYAAYKGDFGLGKFKIK